MSHHDKHDPVVSAPGTEPAQTTTPPPAEAAKTVSMPEAELAKLKAEAAKAAEHWDKFLRAAADLDNYRKRVAREKEELTRATREAVINTLLPTLDNLERALDHSPEGTPLHDGLLQVQKQLQRDLAGFGLAEIAAKPGEPFDPNFHEAVSHIESNEQPDGAIIQQLQNGYKLGDRLLRAARVVVSKGKAGSADASSAPTAPAAEKKNSWFKSPFSK
ncbi:MAG: nucleotide exchange factor GrpE [Verrucomicrobia bacterium]|nr:nucleotide exchange factor GrpE [Verrucomicrobiota bacterium]